MNVFISYILLGLSLAAPIGPINAAQLDKGIKYGFLHAWLVGVGAVVADAIYMLIVYLGVVQFISTPFMKTFLWLFGSFVLLYSGIESIYGANKINLVNNRREDESKLKTFFSGFFMSLTNPLSILFWLGIYGSVLAQTTVTYGPSKLILYSSAIFIGLLIWDIAMASAASVFRRFLTNRGLTMVSLLSGVCLILFGIYFGYQAFKLLIS
ncbi:LysE family transporter [Bacillus sp. Marseille-P3661]|uniref:LysE family transporter n=1 Tax=Bacillus sp. Marseille-P3661 TaxID=1936234 RepID=UPI000C85CAA6|nr:LysE family transporter [Bacillus sp. Marseille-P3661]